MSHKNIKFMRELVSDLESLVRNVKIAERELNAEELGPIVEKISPNVAVLRQNLSEIREEIQEIVTVTEDAEKEIRRIIKGWTKELIDLFPKHHISYDQKGNVIEIHSEGFFRRRFIAKIGCPFFDPKTVKLKVIYCDLSRAGGMGKKLEEFVTKKGFRIHRASW